MNNTNTGGPAFPCEWDYINSNREAANGMTLRDYFAAKAMNTLILEVADWKYMPNDIAKFAYIQADAMLKARET
jgi:hypothetical protein